MLDGFFRPEYSRGHEPRQAADREARLDVSPIPVMPVFHIHLNGKMIKTAGVGDLGVLGAHVTWVRRTGEHTLAKKPDSVEEELTLHVGGIVTPAQETVRWLDRNLKVGDEVRIIIGEDSKVDRPRSRERRDRVKDLRSQKQYVRAMAKKFGWKIQTKSQPG
jgi:hypothetical protein